MRDKGQVFADLVHLATKKGIIVRFAPLRANDGRIRGDRIAIRQDMPTIDDFNHTLAHELAHAYLHYDKGDITGTKAYEEDADRAALLLLDALNV